MNANTFPISLKVSVAVDMTFQLNGASPPPLTHSEGVFLAFSIVSACALTLARRATVHGAVTVWPLIVTNTVKVALSRTHTYTHNQRRAAMRTQSPENSTREKKMK